MRSRPPKKGECPKRYSKREAIIADRRQLKVLRMLAADVLIPKPEDEDKVRKMANRELSSFLTSARINVSKDDPGSYTVSVRTIFNRQGPWGMERIAVGTLNHCARRILADQRANLMEKSNARSDQGASEVREAP